jgi:hypothetical protein
MKSQQGTRISVAAVGMSLVFLLTPFAAAQAAAPPQAGNQIPDSPSTVQARLNRPQALTLGAALANPSQFPDPVPAPSADSPQAKPESGDPVLDHADPGQSPSTDAQDPQKSPHEPVGTAVAQPIQTTGIAAARPVGAAIAPGKQRRTRSILIKVGALVGAGVAVGTTMALSLGSSSRPPGSH